MLLCNLDRYSEGQVGTGRPRVGEFDLVLGIKVAA